MNDAYIQLIWQLQLTATLFMTGVIWFVQVVHYPLFDRVGCSEFAAYEQRHTFLTQFVVGPAMLLEGITASLLFWFRPAGIPTWPLWTGVVLLAVNWLSTAFVQIPRHELLSKHFDSATQRRLVNTNWLRTVAWSLRSLLVVWMNSQALEHSGIVR